MPYLLLTITLVAGVAGQLLLKKGLLVIGQFPQSLGELLNFFSRVFSSPFILSAVFLWIIAVLAWIFAATKAEMSYIYPFMALSFVLVALFSMLLFKENVTLLRWLGIIIICGGVFLVTRS
jgi:drug/metabolite transporter (DMT)-like permease